MDYRFHPVIHRVKEILESKELGAIKNISATFILPTSIFKDDDIQFDYSSGGRAMMYLGCGCYFFSKKRYKIDIDTRLYHQLHSIPSFLDRGFSGFCYTRGLCSSLCTSQLCEECQLKNGSKTRTCKWHDSVIGMQSWYASNMGTYTSVSSSKGGGGL